MWILQLAWKNLWRNKSRTVITMASIFFAVLLSVLTSSLKTGVFDNLIKNVVSFYSGYVQVHKNGYWDEQVLDNSFTVSPQLEKMILSDTRVTAITPRLESFALASAGLNTKGCLVIGIDPVKEDKITKLSSKLIAGQYLAPDDNGILIAEGLLKRMKLRLHDTLVLIGQGYHGATAAGKYYIRGIAGFGSPNLNNQLLYLPLAAAQNMFEAPGILTSYVLSVRDPSQANSISSFVQQQIGKQYEVMSWEKMMPDIKQHIKSDSNSMQVVQLILYLLISFGIFGTLLMMMAERRFELGMLVAIGMKKSKLAFLLLAESVLTVLMGCLLGIAASIPIVLYLNRHPIRLGGDAAKAYERFGFEAIFPTSTDSIHYITQGLLVLLIGLLLSLYPVVKLIRLNPVESMKK